jgi:hypothetical protein
MHIVPVDVEDVGKSVDAFIIGDDVELVIHFTQNTTRLDVEAMAELIADRDMSMHTNSAGQTIHLMLGSTQIGSKTQPALFKGLGESITDGEYFKTREAATSFIMCLWRKLGYTP